MNKTKKILLTQGKFAIVDAEDYAQLNRHKWHVLKKGCTYYVGRMISCNGRQITRYMHQDIIFTPKGMQINYINHNGLDNRKANLCIRTHQQRNFARRPMANKMSGFKGICWNSYHHKWQARITCDYKRHFLGYFDDEIKAADIYDAKAIELFGDSCYLNFPPKQKRKVI